MNLYLFPGSNKGILLNDFQTFYYVGVFSPNDCS